MSNTYAKRILIETVAEDVFELNKILLILSLLNVLYFLQKNSQNEFKKELKYKQISLLLRFCGVVDGGIHLKMNLT